MKEEVAMDYYDLVIWSRNYDDTFERQAERAYDSLVEMSKIEHLVPKYLTAASKESAPDFELTKENLKLLMESRTDKKFPEIGEEMSFFTSKDDDKICGISLSTGKKKELFVNSITINIAFMDLEHNAEKREQLINLFHKLIEINDAFYGCVVDNANYSLHDGYYDHTRKLPKSVFWLNFWGEEVINLLPQKELSLNKIRNEIYQLEQYEKGYFIRLTETSIFDDEEKISFQKKINKEVGLELD